MQVTQIDIDQAECLFRDFPENVKFPGGSPIFVANDACNYESVSPVFLLFERNDKRWLYNFLMGRVLDTHYHDIFSPYGYGGPMSDSEDKAFISDANNAFDSWLIEHDVIAEFIRFHPVIKNWRFSYADTCFDRNTVMVDLFCDDLFFLYKKGLRRDIRRSIRSNVVVDVVGVDDVLAEFVDLYAETMARNVADDFFYFGEEYIEGLVKHESSFASVASVDGAVVSVGIFLQSGSCVEYHLSGTSGVGLSLEASKIMLHGALNHSKKIGARYVHLGGGVTKSTTDPLLKYKRMFSCQSCEYFIGRNIVDTVVYEKIAGALESGRVLPWR